jgi:CheY-like chemotaxis protein
MKFLVIDDNGEIRAAIAAMLLRHFPNAAVVECQSAVKAAQILQPMDVTLVVAHRTHEYIGPGLIRELRQTDAGVPIIGVSSSDKRDLTLAAGATRFHAVEDAASIGSAAAELLRGRRWLGMVAEAASAG